MRQKIADSELTAEQRASRKAFNANLEKNASIEIDDLLKESATDREYNAKFNKIYAFTRKALVVLKAKKVKHILSGESLYSETKNALEQALQI